MSPAIDVRTELRRITSSKPVHAAAGAGMAATEALRELPARLAKWRTENDLAAVQHRASGYVAEVRTRAIHNVTEVRTRAIHNYDRLATRGAKVLNGKAAPKGKSALDSKRTGAKGTSTKGTGTK